MKPKILVSHPGLQHSHHSAEALFENDYLQKYYSGIPLKSRNENNDQFLITKLSSKVRSVNISKEKKCHPYYWQLYLRCGRMLTQGDNQYDFIHKVFHQYDDWFSKKIYEYKPDIIIGYENSCAKTFEVAKSLGVKCILDEPSMHYKYADSMLFAKETIYRPVINERKETEIRLADAIITCSNFAKKSYIENGVDEKKIYPILLGSTLPSNLIVSNRDYKEFLYAGALIERKSLDLILNVFKRLEDEKSTLKLKIIGGCNDDKWIHIINGLSNVSYMGSMSQSLLYAEMAKSACLLLPSRFDSFGMVVAEANSVGTPAIVSKNTGAKEMIEKFPGSGWIIDATENEIYNKIKYLGGNITELVTASSKAIEASRYFSWDSYKTRFIKAIEDIIDV
jgi:glycosyltransferase involved in cell wall biosynthesis